MVDGGLPSLTVGVAVGIWVAARATRPAVGEAIDVQLSTDPTAVDKWTQWVEVGEQDDGMHQLWQGPGLWTF